MKQFFRKKPVFFLAFSLLMLWSCAQAESQSESPKTPPPSQKRLIAIGDLHGDYQSTLAAFQLAGAIDAQGKWIGKNLTVVQTGDQLDRGDGEYQILNALESWQTSAPQFNSQLYVLNGNHEMMNVQGDLRYVTEAGFKSFQNLPGLNLADPRLAKVPDFAKGRAAAFLPGGKWALKFAERPVILQLDDTLFVHGGVLPAHIDMGIEKINTAYQSWLKGDGPLPKELNSETSPIWTRAYSLTDQPADCQALETMLKKAKAKRLVVAHTVHKNINSACNNQVWRIDVGMAQAYGGPVQVLEIQNDKIRILKGKQSP